MLLAILIGLILGFIGGGGSILAVPVLVYVLGVTPVEATAYSLFIVGVSSLFGAQKHYKLGNIDYRIGMLFAIPSLSVCLQAEDGFFLIFKMNFLFLEIL